MIYTIGHSTRSIADFEDLLYEHEIELVVDIRTYPGSSRYPHFNREQLFALLYDDGFLYYHLALLGGRRSEYEVDPSTISAWRVAAFRNYASYMQTPDFAEGLSKLISLSEKYRLAYMCSEAVWWRCHRRMVSDVLVLKNYEVRHIVDGGLQLHKLSDGAILRDGCVMYPGD